MHGKHILYSCTFAKLFLRELKNSNICFNNELKNIIDDLDNKELLINKIDHSYFYLEDGDFYLSKEMTIEEKEEVIPRVCSVLKFLKTFHDKDKNKIDLLYYDIDIVNYDRVKVVIDDDILELVIPDFYEVSLVWMKMAVVLKKTREVIGSIEFNFNQDESNFYDYKGNVSYEIKRE